MGLLKKFATSKPAKHLINTIFGEKLFQLDRDFPRMDTSMVLFAGPAATNARNRSLRGQAGPSIDTGARG